MISDFIDDYKVWILAIGAVVFAILMTVFTSVPWWFFFLFLLIGCIASWTMFMLYFFIAGFFEVVSFIILHPKEAFWKMINIIVAIVAILFIVFVLRVCAYHLIYGVD